MIEPVSPELAGRFFPKWVTREAYFLRLKVKDVYHVNPLRYQWNYELQQIDYKLTKNYVQGILLKSELKL